MVKKSGQKDRPWNLSLLKVNEKREGKIVWEKIKRFITVNLCFLTSLVPYANSLTGQEVVVRE